MSLAGWIVALIIGAIVGWLVGKWRKCPGSKGWMALLAGIIGFILGSLLLGNWGLMVGGGNLFGGIIGAFLIAIIILLFVK